MRKNITILLNFFVLISFFILAVKSDPIFELGKDVFLNKAVCSSCHMLVDAKSDGQIGPNLNDIRPDKARVLNAVKNGIGVMPAYEGQLTNEEIEAVSYYVFIAADKD